MILARLRKSFVAAALVITGLASASYAGQSRLGKVDFPTSGSPQAQTHFLRGVAALHSFWFEEALDEFRKSTELEPDFMMGYWGEAMAYNHPLWSEQDTEAARKIIPKIKDTPKLSPRERVFLNAVKLLYGDGDKLSRDLAYSRAMERVHRDYPDDLEAACFYALSLLGTVRTGDKGFARQMKAGAIALDVYQKNPNHPGAAHYIIHAFDDPEHAILALPAARRYAEIAPEAAHARHMPAHIFLQLGMWPEAAASNESAWQVSDEWVRRKNLSLSLRDYHSLHWLLYVYLQQGRFSKAEELLGLMRKTMAESKDDNKLRPNYYANNYATMSATFVVETERWDLAESLFPPQKAEGGESAGSEHAGHAPTPADATVTVRASNRNQTLPIFVRGFAAASKGSPTVEQSIAALREIAKQSGNTRDGGYGSVMKTLEVRQLELAAASAAAKSSFEEAIESMRRATALEEDMSPPSGPPGLVKPSHELFGEILLRAGRAQDAAKQFAASLARQPNRARSLLGAARAAVKLGDSKGATEAYSAFLRQWIQADPMLPELREAREYLKPSHETGSRN
jgi:tetratricopeptide (TPR) repeat protein